MDLRTYMFKHRLSGPQMAKLLGCAPATITNLRRGGRAGKWLADEIEGVTKGEITAIEVRPPATRKKREKKVCAECERLKKEIEDLQEHIRGI